MWPCNLVPCWFALLVSSECVIVSQSASVPTFAEKIFYFLQFLKEKPQPEFPSYQPGSGLQRSHNQPATKSRRLDYVGLQPTSPQPAPDPSLFLGTPLALGETRNVQQALRR